MYGNLGFRDSDKIAMGQSSDLQIYHDGSNSYIDHNGAGDFIIRTENTGENLYIKLTPT